MEDRGTAEAGGEGAIRRMLLVLVLLGGAGLTAELVLLEHTEDAWQWAPFVVLGGALLAGAALATRPTRATVRLFQALMALLVLTGLLGIYLHYRGNEAFELEMDEAARGLDLLWRALRGATPALAPGALVQLGLLGLILSYRHPALGSARRPPPPTPERS